MRSKVATGLILSATVALLVPCVFQLVNKNRKEAAIDRWQTQLAASNLSGQSPVTVIAFLDYHHLPHSTYEKVPYNVGEPHSPGHHIDLDRHIFVEFGPVAHTFEANQGYSDWYIITNFNFASDGKLGGWSMTSSPKKVRDGEILCCAAISPYGQP